MLSYKLFSKQFMTSAFRLVLCRLKDKRFSLSEVRQKFYIKIILKPDQRYVVVKCLNSTNTGGGLSASLE